jgi:hypothetical protein
MCLPAGIRLTENVTFTDRGRPFLSSIKMIAREFGYSINAAFYNEHMGRDINHKFAITKKGVSGVIKRSPACLGSHPSLLSGVTTAKIILYIIDIHPKFWTIFANLQQGQDVETHSPIARSLLLRRRGEATRFASGDQKYNLMFEFLALSEAKKEENQEEYVGFVAEIEGLIDGKLELDGIYGSRITLSYGKKCPRLHMLSLVDLW